MALSVSGFPEPDSKSQRLRTLFGRAQDEHRPLPLLPSTTTVSAPSTPMMVIHSPHYQPVVVDDRRPLPRIPSSSSPSPSSSPTRQPTKTLPYKRARTSSHAGLTTPTSQHRSPVPISWASRPVDLNAQRPAGASGPTSRSTNSTIPRRHISATTTSTASVSSFASIASALTPASTPPAIPASTSYFGSNPSSQKPLSRSRSHSSTRLGIRRERSLDGLNPNMNNRMTPPLPCSAPLAHGPLGLSFARLASVSVPSSASIQGRTQLPNRVQSQSAKLGARERGNTIIGGSTTNAATNVIATTAAIANATNRPTFRPLPYKSPTITASSDPEPSPNINTKLLPPINTNKSPIIPNKPSPMITSTATSPATAGGVIIRPTIVGPRSAPGSGQKQKLQLSLQIPSSIPMLGQEQGGAQDRSRKPQLPALKVITDTTLHPASDPATISTSSPSIKLCPSPTPSASPISPSISYVSYSHSPVSPTNPGKRLSPVQMSPTHSSLFSADSRIHLHPLSLSSPISVGTGTSGSASVSVRGWVIGGGGGGGGGGGTSPGGRSVKSGKSTKSTGGRRPRSVRSTRSMRSNRSRRSTNIPIPLSAASPVSTPTPIYSNNAFTFAILGDHVGEYVGEGDGAGSEYVEDGWGDGAASPSPIRYARPDSRGNLSSDTEDGRGKGDDSAASSEVEFADVDIEDDDDFDFDGRVMARRRWRSGGRRMIQSTTPVVSARTHPSSPSLSLSHPQLSHSSHSPTTSPVSSSSSTNSYSNPYTTRKDRKRARRIQPRSFRNSYRMPPPPVVPVEPERGRGLGAEKGLGRPKSRGRASSPTVMISMIPFRRKTPPPAAGPEEQVEVDSVSTKKKDKKQKEKDGKKGKPPAQPLQTKKKSAKNIFNTVSASVSASYAPQSQSQSALASSQPQSHSRSQSGSGSTTNTRTSSPERGSKSHAATATTTATTTTRKTTRKFAEAVSLALEEVTSRGRTTTTTIVGGSGGPPTPFLTPPVKMKASSTTTTTTSVQGGGSALNLGHSVPFDEMEVLDISLPGGGGGGGGEDLDLEEMENEDEEDGSVELEKSKRQEMVMGGGGEGASSSLPESGRFSTVISTTVRGGSSVLTISKSPPPLVLAIPSISQPPPISIIPQRQKQKSQDTQLLSPSPRRGNSLGREVGDTISVPPSSNIQRRQYPNPYNRTSTTTTTTTLQLQPACTTGISCASLPVSRPPLSRSSLVPPPFSAPNSASSYEEI